ncbi:MAG: preprotein translocase subunit SecE [Clostridia bacterium]|nr:preprotein translocase subunit SecE [Clostridia bacterium]
MSEEKKVVKKDKKPNAVVRFFKWIGRKFKEMFSELKKVTWPDFAKVMKQTGIVLGVVFVFLVVVTVIDFGFQELLTLVSPK